MTSMIGYKRVNFFELCRLCTTYEGCKTPIFDSDNNIVEKIKGCLHVEVTYTDHLPKYICLECLKKLDECYSFTTSCRSSDATLQRYAETLIDVNEPPVGELMVYVKDNKLSEATTSTKKNNNIVVDPLQIENTTATVGESMATVVAPFSLELSEVIENEVVILDNAAEIYVEASADNFTSKPVLLKNVARILNEKSTVTVPEEEEGGEVGEEEEVEEEPDITPMSEQEKEWELKRHDEGYLTYCPDQKEIDENRVMHECETCSKQFKRREHLTQHRRLHTGERPFKCDYCEKSFNRKEHLVRHARSHTGEKCYSCDVCNRGFSRKDNLRKHQSTHEPLSGECVSKRSRHLVQLVGVGSDGAEERTLAPSAVKKFRQETEEESQESSSILILNESGNELIQLDDKQSILLKALTQES